MTSKVLTVVNIIIPSFNVPQFKAYSHLTFSFNEFIISVTFLPFKNSPSFVFKSTAHQTNLTSGFPYMKNIVFSDMMSHSLIDTQVHMFWRKIMSLPSGYES
jgi:hypothetical protein